MAKKRNRMDEATRVAMNWWKTLCEDDKKTLLSRHSQKYSEKAVKNIYVQEHKGFEPKAPSIGDKGVKIPASVKKALRDLK